MRYACKGRQAMLQQGEDGMDRLATSIVSLAQGVAQLEVAEY